MVTSQGELAKASKPRARITFLTTVARSIPLKTF